MRMLSNRSARPVSLRGWLTVATVAIPDPALRVEVAKHFDDLTVLRQLVQLHFEYSAGVASAGIVRTALRAWAIDVIQNSALGMRNFIDRKSVV